MQTFTDSKSRNWLIEINISKAREIKKILGINLLGDYCCEDKIKSLGITDEDFISSLEGDVMSDVIDAVYEAIADFCPSQSWKKTLRLAMKTQKTQEAEMLEAMDFGEIAEMMKK